MLLRTGLKKKPNGTPDFAGVTDILESLFLNKSIVMPAKAGISSSLSKQNANGFTLIEMSVVLVIIGLLIMTVFPALTTLRTSTQRAQTQTNLRALMLATAAYVQANGCLPCPTPADKIGNLFGRVRGDTATTACNGCNIAEGIAPFISLGIPADTARDGWNHWITMRVDPALTVSGTVPLGGQTGLCQANLATASRVNVKTPNGDTQKVAVIFVSHGARGAGALIASASGTEVRNANGCRLNFPGITGICPQNLTCNMSDPRTYAQCNATGNNQFVNATMRDDYDDQLIFADRNVLVSMLGNAACQTAW